MFVALPISSVDRRDWQLPVQHVMPLRPDPGEGARPTPRAWAYNCPPVALISCPVGKFLDILVEISAISTELQKRHVQK